MTQRQQPESAQQIELKRALSDFRRQLAQPAAFSFFINVLMLTGPLYMLQVYDRVVTSQSVPTLVALTVLIFFLYVTLGALLWIRSGLLNEAASNFQQYLSDKTANAAFNMRLRSRKALDEQVFAHLKRLRNFLASPAISAILDAPFSPLFFIVLFMLHPLFGLWAIISCVVLVALGLLNQKASARALGHAEELDGKSQLQAKELLQNADAVQAMGMRSRLTAQWSDLLSKSDRSARHAASILSGFDSITRASRLFLQSAVLGLGAYLAIQGVVSFGAMIAASILMGRAIAPIEQLIGSWKSVASARYSWSFLKDAISEHSETRGETMPLPDIKGDLSVEQLYVVAPGTRDPILKSVNFSLNAGDALGVLGPSAAGKTTLLRSLAGILPATTGTIRLDGADIGDYEPSELGRQLGYLPQQIELLSGTVQQNICRFQSDASPEAIVEAARLAGCHDLILRLSSGYDTQIGPGGTYLSAGQRQRIGLARAIFGNPPIIILDEPNANLDLQGEKALQNAYTMLSERKTTVIVVAHRPQSIMSCNKLLVMENGEVRAFGAKDDVLAKLSGQMQGGKLRTVSDAQKGSR